MAEPLVPPRWAAALGVVGVALPAGAHLLPQDFQGLAVLAGYVACVAAGLEFRQPAWFRARPLVSQPLALVLGNLAAAVGVYAESSGVGLAHVLGAALGGAAGVIKQETVAERGAP